MFRPASSPRTAIALAGACIVLAALAAYRNSLPVPFLFDDTSMIVENPTIRHLSDIGRVLVPPNSGSGVTGRPLINFSLAVNYALGGMAVEGYHATNLGVHILAGLVLFGLVRRTLLFPVMARFSGDALPLAFAIALIWTLHPLLTESVTCVAQRTELFLGLFYLLTLYCFVRGAQSASPVAWNALAVASCALGMASKEVMVTAPLMVLLYDRTFVAGTFGEAWARRSRLYVALAGTWILLGYLVAHAGGSRGTSAGFGLGVTWWAYALKQCEALVRYLGLSVWPHPLILDYGNSVTTDPLQVWPQALLLIVLAVGTLVALWRRPVIGFLGAWFFVILAPSSSVVPLVTQTIAEHRMYLPLAAIVGAAVGGFYLLAGPRVLPAFLALAIGLGVLTARRNDDFRSDLSIWSDTVAHCPDNARSRVNLGNALKKAGKTQAAISEYAKALQLKGDYPEAWNDVGAAFIDLGRPAEAVAICKTALVLRPDFAEAHNNLATALAKTGQTGPAIEHFEDALRLKPDFAEAHSNLGSALLQTRRLPEAIHEYQEALRTGADDARVHNNLGIALLMSSRVDEAAQQFKIAIRLDPAFADPHYNLATALANTGLFEDAVAECETALRLKPDFAAAQEGLDRLLALRRAN
jgi:tetratricopeptide (TPR) repeat protein